jgi:hypothetical protein
MHYEDVTSQDPRWADVQVGQHAVVRLNTDGEIEFVYTVEGVRPLALSFARTLGGGNVAVFYRASTALVDKVPWQ